MNKKIVLTGATGLIGKNLSRSLMEKGYRLYIISRNPITAQKIIPDAAKYLTLSNSSETEVINQIENAKAVIHLAGASVAGKRWSDNYKKEIRNSRIYSTKKLVEKFY